MKRKLLNGIERRIDVFMHVLEVTEDYIKDETLDKEIITINNIDFRGELHPGELFQIDVTGMDYEIVKK